MSNSRVRDLADNNIVFVDGISTLDITESNNLFFTNARADARISLKMIDEDNMSSNSSAHMPTQQSVKSYVDTEVSGLVDTAPGTLDTLNELAAALGDDANFSTTVTNSIAAKLPLAGGAITGNVTFGDNNKAIFCAGSDLQIYHNGDHSIIEDAGTGAIKIKVGDFRVENASGNNLIKGVGDVATLHHAGTEKLATTSTGIDVTGTVTSDGLTVDNGSSGQSKITISEGGSNSRNLVLYSPAINSTNAKIAVEGTTANLDFVVNNGSQTAIRIGGSTGDISFYEDTGTTAKFLWDASAEKLGVGTTPNNKLTLSDGSTSYTGHGGGTYLEVVRGSGADAGIILNKDTGQWMMGIDNSDGTNPPLRFEYSAGGSAHAGLGNGTVGLTLNYQGKVGIGTNDPAYRLDVGGIGAVQQRLKSSGDTGYTQGALVIESSDSSDNPGNRGQGVYYYNVPNLRTWYTGTLYNNGNKFGFGYKQASGIQSSAADNANAIMILDGDNSLLEVKKTRPVISSGTNDTGAVLKLHTEAQWESGYGNNSAAATNDYLGSIEFSTGDNSTGEGVRAAIRGTVDSYYNQNSIVFETAGGNVAEAPQERMRVLHNGNVGIGTASPGAKLSVSGPAALANLGGGSTGSSALYVNSTSGHVGELIQVLKDGTTKMHMANDGDLALGHTSPSDKLDIQGADNGLTIRSETNNRPVLSLINGSSTMLKMSANGTYAAIGDGTDTNRYMSFKDGNVGINTTNPTAKFYVAGDTLVTGNITKGSGVRYEPEYQGYVLTSDNNYKLLARISSGSGYSGACEFSLAGTTNSTVFQTVGVASANHSYDGTILTHLTSHYSGLKIKIVSDANNAFELYVAVNTYSSLDVGISYTIRKVNGNVTMAPSSASYSSAYLVHQAGNNTMTTSASMPTGSGPTAY